MLNVPHILDYLFERYVASLAKLEGRDPVHLRAELDTGPLHAFLAFSTELLNTNRPSGIAHEEANYIIGLMDGSRYSVAPPLQAAGSMQQSPFYPVTGSDTLKDLRDGMPTTMMPFGPAEDRSKGGPQTGHSKR